MDDWKDARGYKYRFFKDGCLEICRRNEDKPTLLITMDGLVADLMDSIDNIDKIYNAGEKLEEAREDLENLAEEFSLAVEDKYAGYIAGLFNIRNKLVDIELLLIERNK